ncbi:MAG: TonB-dependent receptor [Bacteroidales bacterium]|nr:TonB-dependent receptor [Bacteroidales bacterium]
MDNRVLVLMLLFFFSFTIYGQESKIEIEKSYDKRTFLEFVDKIEKEYQLHFFYRDLDLDTFTIKQPRTSMSLNNILEETFANQSVFFYTDSFGNVVISREYKIESSLPVSFQTRTYDISMDEEPETGEVDFLTIEKQPKNGHKSGMVRIGNPAMRNKGANAMLSGVIREVETGEPIAGAVVYVEETKQGVVTDLYGYYVINIPKGTHNLVVRYVGRKEAKFKIVINDNGSFDIDMEEELLQLKGVVISAEKEHNVKGLQIGMEKLEISTIKQIPASMGEVDLLKTALLLPGVQTVGEGASGFNVRGGSTDQNLVLLDGAPIFNSSHIFGFFSVFNADVVKEFRLYKSGIPAKYGGRISSVFDVSVKNGNRKKISGSGGISPITGRLSLEGPLFNEKASFLIAGRTTYSDWILKRIDKPSIKNSDASFYDFNAKLTYDVTENDFISITVYNSADYFKLSSDTTYNYNNWSTTAAWKHVFTKKFYGILSGIYTKYDYSISSKSNPNNAFDLKYYIDYKEARTDFSYFLNSNHSFSFGGNAIYYSLSPNSITPIGDESIIEQRYIPKEYGVESAIYFSDEIKVNDFLSVDAGVRYTMFFELGPKDVNIYSAGPKTMNSIVDTVYYAKNKIVKKYSGPEVRISARYKTGVYSSVKMSYNHNYQYIQMLSNSTSISPTDMWKLCDSYIPPVVGNQFSIGFYKNIKDNTIETSIETYYKLMNNVLEYKPGAQFILNPAIETDVLNGIGRAYGTELMIKKKYGKLNGWVSYTYSRTKIKVDGEYLEERINRGEFFPANFDKPHDFTLVSNYKYSRRLSLSNNFTYSTGRPITMPAAKYMFMDRELIHYTQRNEYRIPDYFRWDISLNIEGTLKSHKLAHSSLSLAVYNVTGRNNVYSIYFVSDPEKNVKGYKLSIFAQPIFTATYNFKF